MRARAASSRRPARRGSVGHAGAGPSFASLVGNRAFAQLARDANKTPPVAWDSHWFPSVKGPPPGAPPALPLFEDPKHWTADGAKAALDEFIKLPDDKQKAALASAYPKGGVSKTLAALGNDAALSAAYADAVRRILRWIEETETRAHTGKTDDEMADLQVGHIKADPKVTGGGWGGGKPRWQGLLKPAQESWTERGKKAITKMATYAAARAPELKIVESTFELEFEKVDQTSLGALATEGTHPGKTLYVGFEFVVTVERDPAYALSTIVHELFGHSVYEPGQSYAGALYEKAASKLAPGTVKDVKGTETFDYHPTEIYSLLKEIPYWTQVSAADDKSTVSVPGAPAKKASELNYDPRSAITDLLTEMRDKWETNVGAGLVRGLLKRIRNDPTMKPASITEFEALIRKVFGTAAAGILK